MMKRNKINAYSALAGTFIFLNESVDAQVIYTDLDPDFVIEVGMYAWINMDNDGPLEMVIVNTNYIIDYTPIATIMSQVLLLNNIYSEYNYFAESRIPFSSGILPVLYAFENNDVIGSGLQFYNNHAHWMHRHKLVRHSVYHTILHTSNWGNWYPDISNHFIGLRFRDNEGIDHYGWVRCSVRKNGKELIIKDYAYELQANVPIITGSTESYVPFAETENTYDASVYSFQKSIYCLINHEDINAELFIYSIAGEKLYTQTLTTEKTEIDFSKYAAGIYVVEIMNGENKCIKKVWVE